MNDNPAPLLRFQFTNAEKSRNYNLDYLLNGDKDFVKRWLWSLQNEIQSGRPILQNQFYGTPFAEEEKIRHLIQSNIETINQVPGKIWINKEVYPNMSHDFLMDLHFDFEKLTVLPQFSQNKVDDFIFKALHDLNINIHRYESLFGNPNEFHIDVAFENALGWHFKKTDYNLFSADLKPRTLYLGYSVTGVPPLDAFLGQVKQRPVPQYLFRANCILYFDKEVSWKKIESQCKNWLIKKWKIDTDKNGIPLGHIPIGILHNQEDSANIAKALKESYFLEDIMILNPHTMEKLTIEEKFEKPKRFHHGNFLYENMKQKVLRLRDDFNSSSVEN